MLCSKNRTLVFDVEANGFLDEATRIWCLYFIDKDTKEGFLFHDFIGYCGKEGVDEEGKSFVIPKKSGSIKDGVLFAHKAKGLIAHNCLGYDFALMKKFFPRFNIRYDYPNIRDTLLESQVQWYDRRPVKGYKGVHGLAVYGARLGIRKPEIEDWTTFDEFKLNRCIQDVGINLLVANYLEEERSQLKEECGVDFIEALTTEHKYRYHCTKQELNGARVDKDHMVNCTKDLDEKIELLRQEIEPQLPPSLTYKGGKITKKDLFKALGLKHEKVPIQYVEKERNGISKQYPVCNWQKPVTKWTNKKLQKIYGISLDNEVLKEYTFEKLKEAREYAKETWPDKKGFKYPNKEVEVTTIDSHTKKHFGEDLEKTKIVGPFTKIVYEDSVMSQHEKVKLLLVSLGWDTDEWTPSKDEAGKIKRSDHYGTVVWPSFKVNGKQLRIDYKPGEPIPSTPKISEDSYVTLPPGLGQKIKEYNTYSHRRKFIQNPNDMGKGLLNNIRNDGRITCGLMTYGTTAGRA